MKPQLFPYQLEGARWLATHERGAIYDEMGLGKSAQAVIAAEMLKLKRGLIICPASVRSVWEREFRLWAVLKRRILKMRSVTDLNVWVRGKADVLICSYEQATRYAQHLGGDLIDFIIVDEAHYLKSPDAARTRKLLSHDCDGKYGLLRWGCHVWFLTGTPNPNDAADIWSMLRFCGATLLTNNRFKERYYTKRSTAYTDRHTPAPAMVDELRAVWRSVGIKRTLAEVGIQIPPLFITEVPVDGDTEEIRSLLADHPGLEEAIKRAVQRGGLSFLDDDVEHIATLRRLIGEAKAPAYVSLIKDELDAGLQKLVVFGHHRRALEIIREGLDGYGVVQIDGSTSERARVEAVNLFQNHEQARVMVANIKAAGTGGTFTAANRLDMFEWAWDPASNAQAVKRIHRIGQERSCYARFISLQNSIDEVVSETVAEKTAAITTVGA